MPCGPSAGFPARVHGRLAHVSHGRLGRAVKVRAKMALGRTGKMPVPQNVRVAGDLPETETHGGIETC